MAGALGTQKGGVMPTSKGSSAPQGTAVGSGSRPGGSRYPIASSAPANPHTLEREPAGGYLK